MVDIAILISCVTSHAADAKNIVQFGLTLKKLLDLETQEKFLDVAKADIEAAQKDLDYIVYEKSKKDALKRALVHLEAAYSKYLRAYKKASFSKDSKLRKIDELCVMIASCHKELSGKPEMVKKWLIDSSSYSQLGYFVYLSCISRECVEKLLTKEQYEDFRKADEAASKKREIEQRERDEAHETSVSNVIFESFGGRGD
ncbi:MAG: hypothetical protein Q4D16_03425 [Eubacteriales bacterium]|nr:hypothetical protein [Eubacteriales bacterium]